MVLARILTPDDPFYQKKGSAIPTPWGPLPSLLISRLYDVTQHTHIKAL